MKPIIFEFTEGDEYLASHSGLGLIGALLSRSKIEGRLNEVELSRCREPEIPHSTIVYSMIGLLCVGKPDYEAIEPFRSERFFAQSLRLTQCPASSTIRQRLDMVGHSFDRILKEESAGLIRRTAPEISSLTTSGGAYIPFDLDVSPFDNSKTKKEGVSRTYKGVDGYAPIFAYVGGEGYLVNVELRAGKQHCQNGTPEFLKESLRYAKTIIGDRRLLVRMDSGNDSGDNIGICSEEKVDWLIKRNIRREDVERWLQVARDTGERVDERDGKTVWYGTTYRETKEGSLRIIFAVTETSIDAAGQSLLLPEIEVETYWTSLDLCPKEIIDIYHDHGTCEQFHSELKTDMDLERLPSERFETNAVVLLFGMVAYNLLRLCGQESLREDNGNILHRPVYRRKATRRRIRTVMQDLIYMACHITHHARKWYISFGKYNPWARVWLAIYVRFLEPVPA